MKRIFGLAVVLALVFACFGFGGVKSELESNEDEIPKLTQADLNYVWLESKGSQILGYNTLKVVNAYVGQTLTENIEIRNKTKETLNYVLTKELMDCENKVVWQDGDKLAMKLSTDKVSLKAGEKKQVPVTIQVQKNHSGNAYFRIFFTPSKGKKEFVSLNICQFDTKAEIMTTKPPAMFKTLNDALKNKTKLGRLIRKPDKTFLVYGNIHLFCFDTKTDKFSWYYNNKTSIIDITIYKGFIFTQNSEKLFVKDGKACVHKEDEHHLIQDYTSYDDFLLESRAFNHLGLSTFTAHRKGEVHSQWPIIVKSCLKSEIIWKTKNRPYDFVTPFNPNYIYVLNGKIEYDTDSLCIYDISTGKCISDFGYINGMLYKSETNLMIILSTSNSEIAVHDIKNAKNISSIHITFDPSNKDPGSERHFVTDAEKSLIFTDCFQVGAYDYSKRKIAWRHLGDGQPVIDPKYDKASNSVYILDEDSKADSNGIVIKKAEYLRLFKFNAETGKQLWKTVLFKLPKDYHCYSGKIDIIDNKVVVIYNLNTFTVRASDGKPWK